MIRHIVFFSARANEDVAAIKAGLEPLGQIPYASIFEVSLNAKVDPLCDAVDIVVYAEFPGQAELAAYKAHPIYAEATRKVKPLRERRYSADIIVPDRSVASTKALRAKDYGS